MQYSSSILLLPFSENAIFLVSSTMDPQGRDIRPLYAERKWLQIHEVKLESFVETPREPSRRLRHMYRAKKWHASPAI